MINKFSHKIRLANLQLCLGLAFISIFFLQADLLADDTEALVNTLDDKVIYQPEFFSRYAPQTAADMVLQIPGFKLDGANRFGNGQNNVRGLGQGEGNLLLNGKRVSSKDNGPLELLARIPAENILSVEVLTQGSTELAGQSGLIVNVVYKEANETNGSWGAHVHTMEKGVTTGSFEGSLSGKFNDIGYSVSLNRFNNEFPQWGEELAFDKNDELLEIRDEYASFSNHGLELSLGLSWQGKQEQNANLNVSGTVQESLFYEDSDQYEPSLNPDEEFGEFISDSLFRSSQEGSNYEVGGDYSRKLGLGTVKFIGLIRSEENTPTNYFNRKPKQSAPYTFQSVSKPEHTEAVFRTLYTIIPQEKHSLEFAVEGVKNTLETSTIFSEDTGNGFEDIEVDGSDVEVDEERAEVSIQYSRPVFTNWSLQSLLGSEYSKLTVNGEGKQRSDSFVRYKGFIALGGPLSEYSSLRTRLERSVGQLSFRDFASSKNINEGTSNGGNTELVPDQTWRAEASYEYKFGDTDIITITGFVERVDDFITLVPYGEGQERRDNIDKLNSKGIDISTTIALDKYGIAGGKLDLLGEFHKNTLIDPVTGREIEFRQNGYFPAHYNVSFRQDIPDTPIAWGIIIEERSGNIRYRLDQTSTNNHRWPQAHRLYIEHKDLAGMTLKVETEDFFGFEWSNSRYFYEGDRNGDVIGHELNSRHSPWIVRISLTGTF